MIYIFKHKFLDITISHSNRLSSCPLYLSNSFPIFHNNNYFIFKVEFCSSFRFLVSPSQSTFLSPAHSTSLHIIAPGQNIFIFNHGQYFVFHHRHSSVVSGSAAPWPPLISTSSPLPGHLGSCSTSRPHRNLPLFQWDDLSGPARVAELHNK